MKYFMDNDLFSNKQYKFLKRKHVRLFSQNCYVIYFITIN